jgi:hypothetical protein
MIIPRMAVPTIAPISDQKILNLPMVTRSKAMYAPSMKISPWAKLIIPRIPKTRVNPRATRAYVDPRVRPFTSCWASILGMIYFKNIK